MKLAIIIKKMGAIGERLGNELLQHIQDGRLCNRVAMTEVEPTFDELVDPLPTVLVPMTKLCVRQLRVRPTTWQHEVVAVLRTPEGELVVVYSMIGFPADQAVVGYVLMIREEAGDPLIKLLMSVSSIAIAVANNRNSSHLDWELVERGVRRGHVAIHVDTIELATSRVTI